MTKGLQQSDRIKLFAHLGFAIIARVRFIHEIVRLFPYDTRNTLKPKLLCHKIVIIMTHRSSSVISIKRQFTDRMSCETKFSNTL